MLMIINVFAIAYNFKKINIIDNGKTTNTEIVD